MQMCYLSVTSLCFCDAYSIECRVDNPRQLFYCGRHETLMLYGGHSKVKQNIRFQ